jgi:hypothetical protein
MNWVVYLPSLFKNHPIHLDTVYNMNASSPASGAPTPEKMAGFKEAGIRKTFVADIGAGFGPYVMGYVLFA